MKIMLACYHTQVLRKVLVEKGHDVHSCDLKPSPGAANHYQTDIMSLDLSGYDMMIGFPPCQYLCRAQEWRCQREPERAQLQQEAFEFVKWLWNAPVPMIALENPVGFLNREWMQPNQIARPWYFGDPYDKEICLWLKNLPALMSTMFNPLRKSINNHTNSRMPQSLRSEIRSSWDYYPGMCAAIADQWRRPIGSSYRPVVHRFG